MSLARPLSFALFTALVSCAPAALPPGPVSDGGPPPASDGGDPLADASLSCSDIASDVSAWLKTHQTCQSDSDCTVITTACDLEGACPTIANTSTQGAYLTALVSRWKSMCGSHACACPAYFPQPGCNGGTCGLKHFGSGAVGDACRYGSDCATGDCALAADSFPDGYCTIIDCASNHRQCPTGSSCETLGAHSYCLNYCGGFVPNPKMCRAGYGCCFGPGPIHPDQPGWCAPSTSGLCTAR